MAIEDAVQIGKASIPIVISPVAAPLNSTAVILCHGASGDCESGNLPRFAAAFADAGLPCVRFTCKPPNLKSRLKTFEGVLEYAQKSKHLAGVSRWIFAGHSMGARVACGAAEAHPDICAACILFSYPLHSPGKEDQLRDVPLTELALPLLFVRGTADAFSKEGIFTSVLDRMTSTDVQVHTVDDGDHGLRDDSYPEVAERPAGRSDEDTPEASTSNRQEGSSWSTDELPADMAQAMLAAPFAAITLQDLGNIRTTLKKFYDRIYYGEVLPPIGSGQMSYARFLQRLANKEVKRITLMADGRVALVEVPAEGWASDRMQEKYDRHNPSVAYAPELPEWQMEKYRYYVELPGDIWEDGYFMDLVKMNQPIINEDGRMPYDHLLKVGQVTTELVVADPNDAYVFLNQYAGQFVPILVLLGLRLVVGGGDWLVKKFGKKEKDPMEELAAEYGRHRAKEFNLGASKRDTGVRYADVAGIDRVKNDIEVTMKMILGDEEYRKIGATPPRGILLEGPPGTGKTYLAKAMAGESGIPFFSANGAEFVEMFQGVAAARIRDLFKVARKTAPAIIFIDEIDAIGKARGSGGGDSGTAEREAGLLQLLCEMDGFKREDQILVIGATNRKDALDDALLRPGRFDRSIYMGRPRTDNRFKILQVHAANKPIPREGNDQYPDDAILRQVAELTIGYSGAELANLLNEAAILAVRRGSAQIDMTMMMEAMDKLRLGLPQPALPDSPAKRRMATIAAGRAVAAVLTPGLPPLEHLTIRPRGGVMGRILFMPQEFGEEGDDWHRVAAARKVNAAVQEEPQSTFELLCGLLVPLYAARATEEVFYGRRGVSLSTAGEVAKAGELAHWLVVQSKLYPLFRDSGIMYDMLMGGWTDPTTRGMAGSFETLTLQMQRAAYRRTLRLVRERRAAIEAVSDELCTYEGEIVQGARIVELVETCQLAQDVDLPSVVIPAYPPGMMEVPAGRVGSASFDFDNAGGPGTLTFRPGADDTALDIQAFQDAVVSSEARKKAAEVIMGRVDLHELTGMELPDDKIDQVLDQLDDDEAVRRLSAVRDYAKSANGAPFPPPPPLPEFRGFAVDDWVDVEEEEIIVL
ncbi:hypothetical protein WJX72_004798 [[Myrmecia] bisecta]|uniref:AAA+ ATPase domain-containing protein n=1 Tax=[Myrmecia] bisecta TaxID=41462 RepID=A0AAW1QAM6_9CHLO